MTVTGNALFHAGITGKGKETLTQFLIYILEGECAEEIFPSHRQPTLELIE